MSTLEAALQKFEATEANLERLEGLWQRISSLLPTAPSLGAPPEYDDLCMAFRRIAAALPAIDGTRVEIQLYEYDEAGRMHLDACKIVDFEAKLSVANALEEQGRSLRGYRFLLNAKRRELVRGRVFILIDKVDALVARLIHAVEGAPTNEKISDPDWNLLKQDAEELAVLLGSAPKPPRWDFLMRHLYFGMVGDLQDIHRMDWPAVKGGLRSSLYGEHDPVPVDVADLADLVSARSQGPVTSKLNWAVLTDEEFERLMFSLVGDTPGYENPQWLQQTHASDLGRDLSVARVDSDPLEGVRRRRIIIQCKHWLSRSVGLGDVNDLRSQMELWQPPRVDGLIIATTGRFTADAIALIEQNNQADRALHISMWPDPHLEKFLAARPQLIGQFRLRQTG